MKGSTMIRYCFLITAAAICLGLAPVWAEQTPPVMPKVVETPLPPPVELPGPDVMPTGIPSRPLTAEEAANIALQRQPDVSAAEALLRAAQGRQTQAKSGLLPALSVTTGYTKADVRQFTDRSTSPDAAAVSDPTGYQASATVRQLLFDFSHTREVVSQAGAARQSARANLTRVQSDLVLKVKQSFYTFAQNQRLASANEANLRNRQHHVELARARNKEGVGLPIDVVRAETAVAEAALALNIARTNSSLSRVGLAELMGIDPRTPIESADTEEPAVAADDPNALVAQALAQRPEMAQAQANVQAAGHAIGAAKTSNAPSLGANAGWLGKGRDTTIDADQFSVGVSIQWTPFNSGLTAGKVIEAKAGLQSAQAQMESTRLAVISDVSQAYLNLKTAEQRLVTAGVEVTNAGEAVRLAQGRYSAGLGMFLDVMDAQTALLTAETNRVNAISSVNQARAALVHAVSGPKQQP